MAPDPPAISLHSVLRRRADLAFVEIDGETIVYDPTTELLHHLDLIATVVWAGLDGTVPLSTLTGELVEASGAEEAVVTTDVLGLVHRLAGDGLVTVDQQPGG